MLLMGKMVHTNPRSKSTICNVQKTLLGEQLLGELIAINTRLAEKEDGFFVIMRHYIHLFKVEILQ